MVKLQVVRIKNGIAECTFSYSQSYKDFVLKELGVKYVSRRRLGKFLEKNFKDLCGPTLKKESK